MADGKFVSYYRVSTKRQGDSGLGLEGQRHAVMTWLNGGNWNLVAEFTEIESGAKSDRAELAAALAMCRARRATLVIAKLDRLARDAHFLLGLQAAGVDFVAVDMPHANRLTIGVMALVAEEERRAISARTTAALAAAKARGVKLGGFRGRAGTAEDMAKARAAVAAKGQAVANDLRPVIDSIIADGVTSHAGIAARLNDMGVAATRGGRWQGVQVTRLLAKLGQD